MYTPSLEKVTDSGDMFDSRKGYNAMIKASRAFHLERTELSWKDETG